MHEKHTIKTACTNGLPGDGHILFETSRRHQDLTLKINLKSVHLLVCVTTSNINLLLNWMFRIKLHREITKSMKVSHNCWQLRMAVYALRQDVYLFTSCMAYLPSLAVAQALRMTG